MHALLFLHCYGPECLTFTSLFWLRMPICLNLPWLSMTLLFLTVRIQNACFLLESNMEVITGRTRMGSKRLSEDGTELSWSRMIDFFLTWHGPECLTFSLPVMAQKAWFFSLPVMVQNTWIFLTCHGPECLIFSLPVMVQNAWRFSYLSWSRMLDFFLTCHGPECLTFALPSMVQNAEHFCYRALNAALDIPLVHKNFRRHNSRHFFFKLILRAKFSLDLCFSFLEAERVPDSYKYSPSLPALYQ